MTTAEAGQCVSLALKRVRRAAVRKGMVIVSKTETPPRGMVCLFSIEVEQWSHFCSRPAIRRPSSHSIVRFCFVS